MRAQLNDPNQPRVTLNLVPAMERAGYIHPTDDPSTNPNHRGRPHLTRLYHDTKITYSTLSDIVNHSPGVVAITLENLAKLCAALRCTPGDLLTYEPPSAVPVLAVEQYFRENPLGDAPPTRSSTGSRPNRKQQDPNIPGWLPRRPIQHRGA